MSQKTYSIELTENGLGYMRQVLGTRPHDEVRPLIESIDFQKTMQDRPAPPPAVKTEAPAPGLLSGGIAPAGEAIMPIEGGGVVAVELNGAAQSH